MEVNSGQQCIMPLWGGAALFKMNAADLSHAYFAELGLLQDLINWRGRLSSSIKTLWMTDSAKNHPLTFSPAQWFPETPVVIA